MRRSGAALVALALGGVLAGCAGDGGETDPSSASPSSVTPSSQAPSSPTASPQASAPPTGAAVPTSAGSTAPPADEGDDAAPKAFPADTRPDVQEQTSGGPLSVREVRVAHHDGYDRVVFELAGRQPGQAGWRVQYVDRPTQQGSGNPVEVTGDAVLSVLVLGTGYPPDTDVAQVAGDPALPRDLEVVEDVVLGTVFEGQYQAFIGTAARAPFRVFRLGEPERVVVDVRTA